MAVKWFERVRRMWVPLGVAALVAALTFAVTTTVANPHPKFSLTSGTGFTITSAIAPSYPTCTGTTAALYPGTPRCLVYTVHNSLSVPLKVTALSAVATSFSPNPTAQATPACKPSDVTAGSFSGALTVTPHTVATATARITLETDGTQDACELGTFHLTLRGSATFTDTTTTVLASSLNPSRVGNTVTFTATVTGTNPTFDTSKPSGQVTFYACTTSSCATKSVLGTGTITQGSGTATYTTSSLTLGTHYLEAVYPGRSTTYTASTSGVLTQIVHTACYAPGTKLNGGFTVKAGMTACIEGTVDGGITVQPGGGLTLQGATVNGGVTSSGATNLHFCASTINGTVTATATTGPVEIGGGTDETTCGANTIKGAVTLTNNKGGVELGGNAISGTVTLANNTATASGEQGNEVEGNAIKGGLSCATSNSPALSDDGTKNTVTGTRSGQCTGTF